MNERRSYKCPKCGYEMLAISGVFVICLRASCNWKIEAKRDEDSKLPNFNKMRQEWQ